MQTRERYIHIVMEYCLLGDLSVYIKRTGPGVVPNEWGGLHEDVVRHFLRQLRAAIEFLRSHSLMHRDLKPQNILLSPSDTTATSTSIDSLPVLKLADFGFARALPNQSLASTLCGRSFHHNASLRSAHSTWLQRS